MPRLDFSLLGDAHGFRGAGTPRDHQESPENLEKVWKTPLGVSMTILPIEINSARLGMSIHEAGGRWMNLYTGAPTCLTVREGLCVEAKRPRARMPRCLQERGGCSPPDVPLLYNGYIE